MSVQERLNKSTVQFLKIAHHVVFARKRYENGRQIVVALIYIAQDAHPIAAITGTDRFWDCHDISKATRSIRRHNKNAYRDWETDRKSTRLNSSHITRSRMPSSA